MKATIASATNDNQWQATWEIFPRFARMTVTQAAHNYWFLYEGTPGGVLETGTDFVVRADGAQTSAATAWTSDLEPEEWVYFSDPAVGSGGRSLFVAQHQNDNTVDSYYAMREEMTVFGFGRDGTNTFLDSTPRQYTIGLIDDTVYNTVAPLIRGAYASIAATVGTADRLDDSGSAGWSPFTLNNSSGSPDRNQLADVNGDGRLDAVVGYEATNSLGKLAWYEQPTNPTGIWTEHVIDNIIGPMSVGVRDMDFDGDLDVVAGEHTKRDPSAGRLFVFENADGQGTSWTRHLVYTGDEHHDGAHIVDIDGDGDYDIVSIGWVNDKVVLYENLSDCVPPGGGGGRTACQPSADCECRQRPDGDRRRRFRIGSDHTGWIRQPGQ